MRVGIDTTPLLSPRSGVGRYVSELLAALQSHAPENEYHPLSYRPLQAAGAIFGHCLPARVARLRLPVRTLWLQMYLPIALRRLNLELCHFTNYVAPLAAPLPSVVTFHDMSLFLTPDTYRRRQVLAIRPFLPLVARRAAAIITVSESARRDLLARLPVAGDRIHVIYEAAAPRFRPVTEPELLTSVTCRYGLPERFLLFVGTVEPRKNLCRVADALAQLKRSGQRIPLVIAGQVGWKSERLLTRIADLGLSEMIRFIGYVPDEDLPAIYSRAAALVFPSHYEGFGLPVLEAMACGTPVVTSNAGAVAEVAGRAAVLVDLRRSLEIAEGIAAVIGDSSLRQHLIEAGLARSTEFSWECTARQTAAVYRSILGWSSEKVTGAASNHGGR